MNRKSILAVLLAGMLLVPTAGASRADARWVFAAESEKFRLYIDASTVSWNGRSVIAWAMRTAKADSPDLSAGTVRYRSALLRYDLDCPGMGHGLRTAILYSGDNGSGMIVRSQSFQPTFRYYPPNTVGAALIITACKIFVRKLGSGSHPRSLRPGREGTHTF